MATTLDGFLGKARTQILTITSPSGVVLSEETIHTIRSPGRSPRHLEFAIGRTRTAPVSPLERQRPSVGLVAASDVIVIAAYQLRPKDRATALDSAIQFEAAIRSKMLAASAVQSDSTSAAHVVYIETTEDGGVDGWIWFTLRFAVTQTISIS